MAKKKSKSKSKHPTKPKIESILHDDMIAAAISSAQSSDPPHILMKVCRLCETKDGPFLDIFDAESVTAKKIDELMPFEVSENDNLPHKICFRCSAKVEELHEFIQKCIKTQESLRSAIGKQDPPAIISKDRLLWEESLNKTKLSNEDICDVLIKRAMEGIPLNAPLDEVEENQPLADKKILSSSPAVQVYSSGSDDDANVSLKQVKLSITKVDEIVTRTSRSSKNDSLLDGLEPLSRKMAKPIVKEDIPPSTAVSKTRKSQKNSIITNPPVEANITKVIEPVIEPVPEKPKETKPPEPQKPALPFNIMDHVSTIIVNGVGILFQCKLCNRNFLKKDIVMIHGCAKNNAPPKESSIVNAPPPAPPKPPTVKYIKINQDYNKPLSSLIDQTIENIPAPATPATVETELKPRSKPKAGPASKVKAKLELPVDPPKQPSPPPLPIVPPNNVPVVPAISLPTAPSLNSRYKLVAGPNNTFQLIEDSTAQAEQVVENAIDRKPSSRKRKVYESKHTPSKVKIGSEKSLSPEVIDLDEPIESQKPEPYPVGLFQPVPHHSSVYSTQPPVPFTTPAMKKQSYTIVQTGNPSKLLISTKPQPIVAEPKKKIKKRSEEKDQAPIPATTVEATPPEDSGLFTFVGIDPTNLLRPSYSQPTDKIIQESQISTSTPGAKLIVEKEKDKYSCNMCEETFTREKKLLAHIQSHFTRMDEEDEQRNKSISKRRSKKS